MSLYEVIIRDWTTRAPSDVAPLAAGRLEQGDVIFLPHLRFEIAPDETRLFDPAILGHAKNASFDPQSGRLGRTTLEGADAPRLRAPLPGSGRLLALLRITKSARTPYDALMLQLHDRMKADAEFQSRSPQDAIDFPAGTTWLAFTDQVSHAAMSGQHQLEQTVLLPVDPMNEPGRSPPRRPQP